MTIVQRRAAVTHLVEAFPTSERRACRLMRLARSRWQHVSRRAPQEALRARLRELATLRPRWGYQRLHILLQREGFAVNHKRVLRLYREEGLAVRRRTKKRVAMPRVPLPTPAGANERWSMDFVTDALADGRAVRCFTLVDDFTRESLAIEVTHSLPALRVLQVLERLARTRGLPRSIVCDNGPEFAGRAMEDRSLAAGLQSCSAASRPRWSNPIGVCPSNQEGTAGPSITRATHSLAGPALGRTSARPPHWLPRTARWLGRSPGRRPFEHRWPCALE